MTTTEIGTCYRALSKLATVPMGRQTKLLSAVSKFTQQASTIQRSMAALTSMNRAALASLTFTRNLVEFSRIGRLFAESMNRPMRFHFPSISMPALHNLPSVQSEPEPKKTKIGFLTELGVDD